MADKGLAVDTLMDFIISSKDSDSRQQFLVNASKFWELYRQRTWWIPSDNAEPYEADRPVSIENRMFEKVEIITSVFFKHIPIVELRPFKSMDYDIAREQNRHIVYAMKEARFLTNMREGTRETMITGMNIYHTGWDASKVDVHGNGDCTFHSMAHDDVYMDPMPGLTDIQRSRFCALCFWLPQDTVLERFGEPAAKAIGVDARKRKAGTKRTAPEHVVKHRLEVSSGGNENIIDIFDPKGDMIPVYEIWYRTMDFREHQLADGGGRKFNRTEPLGRVAWLVNGKKVKDISNPNRKYKRTNLVTDEEPIGDSRNIPVGHGQFPIIRQVAYQVQDRDRRRGLYDVMGILEQLESLQWDINDISRQMSINARTIANPPTIVNKQELVHPADPEQLILYPAMKIIVKGNRPISEAIHIQQPPSIPSFVQYLHESKHRRMDSISGIKGFVAGNIHQGTSHTTAEGTSIISEADFSQMWSLIYATEQAMVGIIRQFAGLMQQYYKEGRYISITENGQTFESEWSTRNINAEFTYDVVSGSSTPQQDVRRIQNVTFAQQVLQPVMENPTADKLQIAIFALEGADLPWTHEFLDWLRKRLEQVKEQELLQEQSQILMEASSLSQGGALPGSPGAPGAPGAPITPGAPEVQGEPGSPEMEGMEGLNRLAQELGMTPEALFSQFAA